MDGRPAGDGRLSLLPEPRANALLLGQGNAERLLLEAARSGRLPHAWLLAGPRGTGKATLAYRFARFMLAGQDGSAAHDLGVPDDDPVFRRVATGTHGDLLTLERAINPDTKKLAGQILVEQAREVGAFLHMSAAESGWRVVVVDSADDLHRSAANAVLKLVEEPPPRVLLLLVSHRPGRLLPTIRSRCRLLPLHALAEGDLRRLLVASHPEFDAPDRRQEAERLLAMADGSIGRALELVEGGGAALQQNVLDLLRKLPSVDRGRLHAFADQLSPAGAEETARLAAELLVGTVARSVTLAGQGAQVAASASGLALDLPEGAGLRRWAEAAHDLRALFDRGQALALDRKQVWLAAFDRLQAASR